MNQKAEITEAIMKRTGTICVNIFNVSPSPKLFERVVYGTLRPREGDAEGPRGPPAAEGHPHAAETAAAVVRHGLGHCTEMYLLR